MSNQIGHAPVSVGCRYNRVQRCSSVRHVTINTTHRDTEQSSVSKPAADRLVPCCKSEISQQQLYGAIVSTQIGHAPVRLEAQGQTAVQCKKNEILQKQKNSSRAVLTQIRNEPGRLEVRAKHQISAGKTRICNSKKQPIMRIEDRLFDRGWVRSAMATRKCGNIYFRKYFMAVRKFTNIFVLLLILMVGSRDTLFLVRFT